MNANLREVAVPDTAAPAPADWAREALENHPVAHTVLANDGTVRWLNPASARLLDCPRALATGQRWELLKPCYSGKLDLDNATVPAHHTWLRRDGQVGHFSAQLARLADGAWLLIEHDVSDVIRQDHQDRPRRLRELVDGSPDCILIIDAVGVLLAHSDALIELLGYDRSSIAGRNILELIHVDDLPVVRERLATGAVVHSPRRFEEALCRCRHADGSWRWFAIVMINALTMPSIEAVIVYARDATRQVELEHELRRRERRFAALTKNSDDMIAVLDNAGRLSFESASVERLLGPSAHDFSSTRLLRLLHPSYRRPVLTLMRDLRQERGGERTIECQMRSFDGQYRWIEAVCVNLIDDPDVAGVLCNARDITARKGAELERDTALVCSGIALWEYDVGYRTTRWIGVGCPDLYGTVDGSYSEDSFFEHMHPDDRPAVRQRYDLLDQELAADAQVQFRTRDRHGRWRWMLERGQSTGFNPVTGARRQAGVCIDITQQRATEEQLTATRDKLQFAMESSQMAYYNWDVTGDTVAGLDDWLRRHSLPEERGSGADARWESYIYPDDLPEVQRRFRAHLRGDTPFADMEYRLRCGDGRLVWLMDRGRVVERDPDHKPLTVIGVLVNIDDRKRVEHALLASEARLSMAIWGGSFGLWEMDVATQRTRWLSDWCEREDFDPCEADHVNSWDSHIHPDDLKAAVAAFSRMTGNETDSFESEYRVQTRSGTWKWIFERSRAIARDAAGQPTKVAGICINVDSRKTAEEELRKSEARYRSVANLTPGFIAELALNAAGRPTFTWASEGFAGVFGKPIEAFTDQIDWQSYYIDDDYWRIARERFKLIAGGTQVDFEIRVRRPDAQVRWLHIISRPMADSMGRYTSAIAVAHDITERKTAEADLRQAQLSMQTIAANSPDWLFLLDVNGRVRYANRPVGTIGVEAMIGQTIVALSEGGAELRREVEHFVSETLAGRDASLQQTLLTNENVTKRYLMHRSRPVQENGKTVGALVISSDITRQQEREQLLRLQARVLETIREGVVLLDARNTVRLTNPAFDRMCGAANAELLGMRIESLLLADPARLRSSESTLESFVRRLDGSTFAAAAVITPMEVNHEPHLLLVISDVTERKLLEREILEVSSLEQQRIGNDLHDGLGQELTGVALMLRALAVRIGKEYPHANMEVGEIVALVNHSIESTRALARGLSPVSIERGGLLPALQTLVERARGAYGIAIQLRRLVRRPLRLEPDSATHLYRIVQEALTNAVRHGRATRVSLTIASTATHIDFSIRDNGRGMTQPTSRRGGIGLKTMTYRAQMLGGELSILPAKGGGTIVRCRCPQHHAGNAVGRKSKLQVTRILPGS